MNAAKVVSELRTKYPSAKIVKNHKENPTEIITEIEPTDKHPDYSLAIAVIDKSLPHYHKNITETYKVIKGKLSVFINNTQQQLAEGEELVIKPNQIHWALGQETWIECKSVPGWILRDHILVKQ